MSIPRVFLNPRVINFGDIDIGNASDMKSVFLTNDGQKSAVFAIDIGRNDLEILIEPMKGVIMV